MAQFYVTLPSNASMSIYPTNTLANYKTCLPKAIELNGQWEVALVEFIYPKNFYNIRSGECFFDVRAAQNETALHTIRVPEGYYNNLEELTAEIHNQARLLNGIVQLSVMKRATQKSGENGKIMIRLRRGVVLTMSDSLMQIFGFETNTLVGDDKEHVGVSTGDVNRSCNTIFVYCDIVQESIVGDVTAPLLRTLNVRGVQDEIVQMSYSNLIYIPLKRNYFSDVEISIKSESGMNIAFTSGRTIVTLHFRRSVDSYMNLFAR